jgi:protein TonB
VRSQGSSKAKSHDSRAEASAGGEESKDEGSVREHSENQGSAGESQTGDDTRLASAGSPDGGSGSGYGSGGNGSGSPGGGARGSYEQLLAAWLERYKQYPDLARRRGLEGTASLRVAIRRDGSVISAALQAPSHHDVLDRAALDLIHRAEPFPRMPNELAGERFEFVVPIRFHLDQRG